MDVTLQTRREKILEARNKEIRLKEKTKVKQFRSNMMLKHCVLQGILGLGGLGGKKGGGKKAVEVKYS